MPGLSPIGGAPIGGSPSVSASQETAEPTIAFSNGRAIFRNGAVGTEQACCCVPPPPGPQCCCVDGAPLDTELAGEDGYGECQGQSFPKPSEPEDCQCAAILTWCGYTLTLAPNTLDFDQYVIDSFECDGDNGTYEFDRVQLLGSNGYYSSCNSCVYDAYFRVDYYKAGDNQVLSYFAWGIVSGTYARFSVACGVDVQWQRISFISVGPNGDSRVDSFPCVPCDDLPTVTWDCNPAP
jgi:hypothetical protein